MVVELFPHQQVAVDKLGNGKVLVGGVGTGKSLTALAYYYTKAMGGVIGDLGSVRRPMPLLVITTAKKRDDLDWLSDAIKFSIAPEADASIPGTSIKVDSWNNIDKYVGITDYFVIFDEQRAVGVGKWGKSFIKIAKANQWIMLSATPADTWMDMVPLFIANGFYKNITQFKQDHVVYNTFVKKYPKIDHYVGVNRLVKLRNEILVEMPYTRHTTRYLHTVPVDYDENLWEKAWEKRWNIYEHAPIKDVGELFRVVRKLVNSDETRIRAVRKLMETNPKLIVFYNFDYELEALRTLYDEPGVAVAEWNGHKHQPIPESERWVYLVQYVAGAEGWNCIETNSMIFYSLTYSYKNFEQAMGRIDRLNTLYVDLHYHVFKSKALIDVAIWKSLRGKKSFNESAFVRKAG